MRIAIRELVRRPGRFAVAGGAVTVLVLLLLFLGALLDGLFLGSSGAIRINDADVFVFSDDARDSFLRSKVDGELAADVQSVEGVESVSGLGLTLLGVGIPGEDEIANGAIIGYERGAGDLPQPPLPGQAYADRRLQDLGAGVGDVVLVGPLEVPLEIVGWVTDSNYLLQAGIWVEPTTWRRVQNTNRPDAPVGDDQFQVLVVELEAGAQAATAISDIDTVTSTTVSLTSNDTVFAIPGIREQNRTFSTVIGVTLFVVGLVVALFFALLTLERAGLYAVLKAVGASNRTLVAGVVVQAIVVAFGAFVIGGVLTWGLSLMIPPSVPVEFLASRALFVLFGVVITATVGGLVSLRRIVAIDPASAIG
ncbi:MAG: ABC transporter permease [Actinomycetia bacterium]|nr:ABC transporter permease [Actinomycetes bacterium]